MLMGLRAEKSLESHSCFGVTPPLHSPDPTQSFLHSTYPIYFLGKRERLKDFSVKSR